MAEVDLRIAYYCTGHGLGHATRVIEVAKHLLDRGHEVVINTAAPLEFFTSQLPHRQLRLRKVLLDSGAFQQDAFTVDMQRSLEEYHKVAVEGRDEKLSAETAWLREEKIGLVVSDVVPLACAAACAARIPSVCVSNFSWDFVYSEYLTAVGARFQSIIWQIAEDYAKADMLLRLPGYCPTPAFQEVIDVPLVARKARKTGSQVRSELGIKENSKLVVFMYGGHSPGSWKLHHDTLPPGWHCVVCGITKLPQSMELPENFILADKDAYTPDLIGAADCLLGKIGYGAVSESLVHHKPFVFVRRDFFNEEPFLRKQLEIYGLAVEMKRRDFLQGSWCASLQHAVTLKSTFSGPTNGAEVVAELLEEIAHEKGTFTEPKIQRQNSLAMQRTSTALGSTRLRDAVVYGYIMHRHALQETVEIPEWYTRGQMPPTDGDAGDVAPKTEPDNLVHCNVVEGDPGVLSQCEDSLEFLQLLASLAKPQTVEEAASELPERRAARSLFRPEGDLHVSRAPGRLDVMGGISDYSGSLVLQMPIAQACHVAAQTHPPDSKPQLWQHIRHRQESSDMAGKPVLRIVSLNSESTNRGHAFDMDMSDLQREGQPLPYAEARAYFKADPSQSWAAYVAGALVVLMHEERHVFQDGLSLLIWSLVPDGKGVSSSAALETAAMSAIAAACGIQLEAPRLASLCQMVENLVVGAPCGVMDQMAAVLGEKDSLMSLRCQPAQILPPVSIPANLKVWGVDSGVRHSVGGQDYGSVRTAAFMGLKILSNLANRTSKYKQTSPQHRKDTDRADCLGLGYLANVPPSEFQQFYEENLPVVMLGSEFLSSYGSHVDTATEIQEQVLYPVRQATLHPIYENFRVQTFRQTLLGRSSEQAKLMGELMFQSHASYSRCGLGSEATDRLVALTRREIARAKDAGQESVLYGAKITGGGSGGTVCILGENSEEGKAALERIVTEYKHQTGGFKPEILAGSSMGAAAFGSLRIRLKT